MRQTCFVFDPRSQGWETCLLCHWEATRKLRELHHPKSAMRTEKGSKKKGSLPISSSKGFDENQPAMVVCLGWCLSKYATAILSLFDVQGMIRFHCPESHTHSWNPHFDCNQAYKASIPITAQPLLTTRTIYRGKRKDRFSFGTLERQGWLPIASQIVFSE